MIMPLVWFNPPTLHGVHLKDRPGVTAYASLAMEDRGELILDIGTEVYKGMVLGERNQPGTWM